MWLVMLTVGLSLLFYGQRLLETQYNQHWHYAPKAVSVSIKNPHLADNPGYHLTKPKPRRESQGYIFWSYACGSM